MKNHITAKLMRAVTNFAYAFMICANETKQTGGLKKQLKFKNGHTHGHVKF